MSGRRPQPVYHFFEATVGNRCYADTELQARFAWMRLRLKPNANRLQMHLFTDSDVWTGGSIELLCALGLSDEERRKKLLAALWSWPNLQGPYARRDQEPSQQSLAQPSSESRYGVALLPGQLGTVAFQATTVEDDDGLWLYAGSPVGSLSRVLPVETFPFGDSKVEQWEHMVYTWLFGLAEHINTYVPFERAIIGWITTAEVDELAAKQIPVQRFHGYIVRGESELIYFPPNRTSTIVE